MYRVLIKQGGVIRATLDFETEQDAIDCSNHPDIKKYVFEAEIIEV